MGRLKFTNLELSQRLEAKKTPVEIAQEFHCTVRAVQKRCEKLGLAAGQMALLHHGKEISRQAIDAQVQLVKISEVGNRWLDYLDGLLKEKPAEAISATLAALERLRPELSEELQDTVLSPTIARLEKLKLVELQILDRLGMLMGEIRKQLELMVKAAADLLEAKRMAEVQRAIIEEIGRESPECKARIIRRLGGLQGPGLLFGADGWA